MGWGNPGVRHWYDSHWQWRKSDCAQVSEAGDPENWRKRSAGCHEATQTVQLVCLSWATADGKLAPRFRALSP
jgi:hypothetical protein